MKRNTEKKGIVMRKILNKFKILLPAIVCSPLVVATPMLVCTSCNSNSTMTPLKFYAEETSTIELINEGDNDPDVQYSVDNGSS